jgi:hypothetical protein
MLMTGEMMGDVGSGYGRKPLMEEMNWGFGLVTFF